MKKIIFLLFFTFLLTSCSIDFGWENTKQIIDTINNKKDSPSCTSLWWNNVILICVWWDGTCKRNKSILWSDWEDCWNALD